MLRCAGQWLFKGCDVFSADGMSGGATSPLTGEMASGQREPLQHLCDTVINPEILTKTKKTKLKKQHRDNSLADVGEAFRREYI